MSAKYRHGRIGVKKVRLRPSGLWEAFAKGYARGLRDAAAGDVGAKEYQRGVWDGRTQHNNQQDAEVRKFLDRLLEMKRAKDIHQAIHDLQGD